MSSPNIMPIFTPQLGDIDKASKHIELIDISRYRNPASSLGDVVEHFLTAPDHAGGNPDLIRYRDRLNNGGTLVNHEVFNLGQNYRELATQVTALKTRLGHPSDAPISIKAYTGKKGGKAPHRDANFSDAGPASTVDAIGLRGAREFGVWVVPQTVDLNLADADFMRTGDRKKAIVEFIASLGGKPTVFRPFSTFTFGDGQGIRVDERGGVWKQPAPSNRQMAVWHSVYGVPDEDGRPVLSAVIRSSNPRSLPTKKKA